MLKAKPKCIDGLGWSKRSAGRVSTLCPYSCYKITVQYDRSTVTNLSPYIRVLDGV